MSGLKNIIIPNLGVNESTGKIASILVKDGQLIKSGELIAEVETTKTNIDISSDYEGYVFFIVPIDAKVSVGDCIAIVNSENVKPKIDLSSKTVSPLKTTEKIITKKAMKLIEEYSLDCNLFGSLDVVKEEDVLKLIRNEVQETNLISIFKTTLESSEYLQRKSIAIYGTGMGAEVVCETIILNSQYKIALFIDDDESKVGSKYLGCEIVSGKNYLDKLQEYNIQNIHIALSDRKKKQKLYLECKEKNILFPILIHQTAFISNTATIDEGCFVKSKANVDSFVKIGKCSIIDNSVSIAHHSMLGDFVHIAPNAATGGAVVIGNRVLVGISGVVSTKCQVGDDVIIGAGAIITNNLESQSIVSSPKVEIIGKTK